MANQNPALKGRNKNLSLATKQQMATTFQAPKGCHISAQGEALWINCKWENSALKGRNKNLFRCQDRKSVEKVKSADLGGRLIIKKNPVDKWKVEKLSPKGA